MDKSRTDPLAEARKEYFKRVNKNLLDSIIPKERVHKISYKCPRDRELISSESDIRKHELCYLCRNYVLPVDRIKKAVNKGV